MLSNRYGRPDVRFADSPEDDDNSVNEGGEQLHTSRDDGENTRTML